MSIHVDRAAIAARSDRLSAAGTLLKGQFVGIDSVIDDLIDSVRVWYLMPEVLSRPVIVNLWGMTGVGKTDLIRKLVRALDFQDRFLEIELSNADTTSWVNSVAQSFDTNGLSDGNPGIVLFDEIQRFNTVDGDGKPMPTTKCSDFWELLSDGRLAKRSRDDLDMMMGEYLYWVRDATRRKSKGEEVNLDEGVGIWEARSMKRTLGLADDLDTLANLSRSQMIARLENAKMHKTVYEPIDHSKTLIIISGNLDEAFSMASMTSEADVDADIFHAFTEKVTVVDVKNALSRRFKPEQVARFGNVHLIYRSLRRVDFEELIHREMGRVQRTAKDHLGITLTIGTNVERLVYRNGVFPVQGVRPVFSSVADIVEANLSKLMFAALMAGERVVHLDYDEEKSLLGGRVGKGAKATCHDVPYVGRLDKVRQRNVDDVVANVAIHESGHAIAYALLLGLVPLQLTAKVASSYAAGFTFPHDIHETRGNLVHKIKVLLAGGVAEEVVFGKEHATVGRSHDREQATQLTIDFIRRYAFDAEFQANYALEFAYSMDKTVTDADVEKMIARLVAETHELLVKHQSLLVALGSRLRAAGHLEALEVADILSEHGIRAETRPEAYLHVHPYAAELASGA